MNPVGSSPLVGMVCWWPFAVADIPDGWILCDGTNGTVDMRNLLALGAPAGIDSGACVGSDSHDHPMNILSPFGSRGHLHFTPFLVGGPPADSTFPQQIVGLFGTYSSHSHSLSGNVRSRRPRHKHTIIDDTESEDSKQLSKEQIFIMKT